MNIYKLKRIIKIFNVNIAYLNKLTHNYNKELILNNYKIIN
jgi:hypothetical protein